MDVFIPLSTFNLYFTHGVDSEYSRHCSVTLCLFGNNVSGVGYISI